MAITVNQAPGTHHSMHEPMWFIAASDNVSEPQFRYVFDVTIDGQTTRHKVYPGATGEGYIELSRIFRSYARNYFTPIITNYPLAIDTDNIVVPGLVEIGEEFEVTGIITVDMLTSATYYGYHSYSTDMPGQAPWQPTLGRDYSWITSQTLGTIYIPRTGSAFLSYLNDPVEVHQVEFQALWPDGTLKAGTDRITDGLGAGKLLVFNLGFASIATAATTTTAMGGAPDGYRIRVLREDYLTSGLATEWLYVKPMCEPKVAAFRLHFLNRFGGFDTAFFTGPTRREVGLERKTLQKQPIAINAGLIGPYRTTTNVYADTVVPYNTRQEWRRKLVSGYVDDATHLWLCELVASPQVYCEDAEGFYYPVVIKTAEWRERLAQFDKMYNLELEIEMGRRVFSQSR